MTIEIARRVQEIPPYLFAHIDRMKTEARLRGVDVIDFGIGDPDLPTPHHVIEALCRAAERPANHRYPSYQGSLACRTAGKFLPHPPDRVLR